ncbi:hypothetical protein Hdeb2414_s0024g00654411 [Helianthus debilis subsp. tardiflorus]
MLSVQSVIKVIIYGPKKHKRTGKELGFVFCWQPIKKNIKIWPTDFLTDMIEIRISKYRRYLGKYRRYSRYRDFYRYSEPILCAKTDNRYSTAISPR